MCQDCRDNADYRWDEGAEDPGQPECERTIERLTRVVEYAANMPDSDTMPEWAQELRHHARTALNQNPPNPRSAEA